MGADSAGVGGLNISIRGDQKIFHNNEYLIGCTSSFRMTQILRYRFVAPPIPDWDVYDAPIRNTENRKPSRYYYGG